MGVKGVMLIVSGLMCLVGFLVVFLGYKKKKRCTEPAVAEIVDIKRSEETDDKCGKSLRKEAGVSSNKRKAYKIGDRVNIRFNPLKPKEFMTTKQKTGAFTGVVLMIFAAVIAGVTLYFG